MPNMLTEVLGPAHVPAIYLADRAIVCSVWVEPDNSMVPINTEVLTALIKRIL